MHFDGCEISGWDALSFRKICMVGGILLLLSTPFDTRAQLAEESLPLPPRNVWITEGSPHVRGIGVSRYTSFNKELSWDRAIRKAVTDLNSNTQTLVYSYGYQDGRGPMRMRSKFGINTFYDTTDVVPTDSLLWHGWSIVRVKPRQPIPDSILQSFKNFTAAADSTVPKTESTQKTSGKWITSTGVYDRLSSNLNKSIAEAKKDALRSLAEDILIQINTTTYYKNGRSHRDFSYSTTMAFQNIRVVSRTFEPDTVRVKIAVRPENIIRLLDE